MEYFLLCWATTCSVTFVINSFVPGKSPRIFLKSDYSNEITGFGFSGWWRSHVDRDDSSGTFPSGHFGGTFAVALGMFYSNKYIGSFVFLMSILIGLSTLWNRYHYFSDLFVGMLCALFGYFVANLHLLKSKNKY
ncbi:Phosphatidic acid phosphatase type 2/haloperoxidase domain-containing protein [Entamoeba marina]